MLDTKSPCRCYLLAGVLLFLSVNLFGCRGEQHYPVTGTVTLDGRPLTDATVAFLPETDSGVPLVGQTDGEGQFILRQTMDVSGAPAGTYRVTISTLQEGDDEAEPPEPTVPERIPDRYNVHSELVREVGPRDNVFELNLSSDGEIYRPPRGA